MLIAGLLFVLSFIIIRPQDFMPGLFGARIILVSMGSVLIVWAMSPFKKALVATVQDKYFLFFCLAIVISTLTLRWISYSASTFIDTLKLAMIYLVMATAIRNQSQLRTVTWALVFLLTAVACYCVLQPYMYDIIGEGVYSSVKGVWQVKGVGIFDNPNDIAYSLVLVIPFYLSVFMSSTGLSRLGSLVLLIISLYAIYLTQSRGGYLAAASCFFFWTIFNTKSRNVRLAVIVVAFLVLAGTFLVKSGSYHEEESSLGRVEAWSAGATMLKEHPLIGVGKEQFIEHFPKDSHNSFVRAGAELGLLGLYAFIGILLYSIKSLMKYGVNASGTNMYRLCLLIYLGSYIVASILSTRTYDIVFIIVIALTSAMERLAVADAPVEESVSFAAAPSFINRQVIIMTVLCLLAWKLFLLGFWRGII
jgi:putative inorganic carbon (hco3(-)) transporter